MKRALIMIPVTLVTLAALYGIAYKWAPRYPDDPIAIADSPLVRFISNSQRAFYEPARVVEEEFTWLMMSETERASVIYTDLHTVNYEHLAKSELGKRWRPEELKEYFSSRGVGFPTGSYVYFNDSRYQIISGNTKANQAVIKELLIQLLKSGANTTAQTTASPSSGL